MIKEKVKDLTQDEVGQVLGIFEHFETFYFRELKQLAIGPQALHGISVSRYYPNTKPPTVVDFEGPDKFYCDEKRKFFYEKKIVFIPIFRGEFLSKADFSERVEAEKKNLVQGFREAMEDKALADGDEIPMFSDAQFLASIDAEAQREVAEMKLRGAAKNKRLAAVKKRLLAEAREKYSATLDQVPGSVPAENSAG